MKCHSLDSLEKLYTSECTFPQYHGLIICYCQLQPPPAPRMKSKMDTLIFTSDSVKATKEEETIVVKRDSYHMPQPEARGVSKDVADNESGGEVEVENVERPVDLYKVLLNQTCSY